VRKSIAIVLLVMLAVGGFSFLAIAKADSTSIQSLWVRMRGFDTMWGDTPVFGWVDANARIINDNGTVHRWAGAHAIWSTERPRLNCTQLPTENVTFTFYAAKLVNQSDVQMNYSGAIVQMSGLWDVVNVTTTILVNETGGLIGVTRTFTPWLIEAPGALRVLPPPQPGMALHFTLAIEGMPMLQGFVVDFFVKFVAIKICDLNDDGKVDLIDLVRVAKRYHAAPGLPAFNPDMDLNQNSEIDLGDLTTVAASIGS